MPQASVATQGSGFAERLLEVIDVGRRTATYKLAVLLAILDLCFRRSAEDGTAPKLLHTRDVAEMVAHLYWPQVRPFAHGGNAVELRQIAGSSASIVNAVRAFQAEAMASGVTSLHLAKASLGDGYESMLDQVEITAAEQPLPRLQTVGTSAQPFPFLYEIEWESGEHFSVSRLRKHGPHGPEIRFRPGAGDELVRLGPLVRPLVELHWTRMVAGFNEVAPEEERLHAFLFGNDRIVPPKPLREAMAEWQGGQCFYCGRPLTSATDADHFVPRVRGGLDSVENLVLADGRCNNDKRDILAAVPYVERWTARNEYHTADLRVLAEEVHWESDPAATPAVARAVYRHLPTGLTPMWWGRHDVRASDPEVVLRVLAPPS